MPRSWQSRDWLRGATISPEHQEYRTWGATSDLSPDSLDGIRKFYFERQALGQLYFQFDIERLIVADDVIVTDGIMTSIVPGAFAGAVGAESPRVDAVYESTTRMLISWPFDSTGLLIDEDTYGVPMSIRKLQEHDVPDGYREVLRIH